ncbi:hypothetical protein TrST_g3674 [Triparma strigata]|uniref:Uncharacterized protein n=1 Tax=Triparma strigata TaxID=1606541 RepID=A0A9W7ET50_9STRA|nr:hypothetical protein TrST_g3674 [Triparma strigata]
MGMNGNDPADSSMCNNGQFSNERFAFMFTPGTYKADVPVGFYTSVYGLGESPTDTNFVGEKWCLTTTCCFLSTSSDAAGYASRGWASGIEEGGTVSFGSQPQFAVRSSSASAFDMPVWNGVFAGVDGAPAPQWNGRPCVKVGDVGGVRVAGLLLEAGPWETTGGMLQIGETGKFEGSAANLIVLSDVFARVGGPTTGVGPVDTMFNVQSGFTVVDNTWLWRADHNGGDDVLVKNSDNPVKNGIVVNADDVFAYGLAAEHTTEDNVVWNGDRGTTFSYQAEIMYDYMEDEWPHSCYRIGEGVKDHKATGLGCYSYFRDHAGSCAHGVDTGSGNFNIDKAVSVWLNGVDGSSIKNVINNDGLVAEAENPHQFYCSA